MSYLSDCPVPYSVLYAPQSSEDVDPTSSRATLTFRTAYSDRAAFIIFACGTVEPGSPTPRIVPLRHPEFPNLYAQRIGSLNTGSNGSGSMYTDSKITVQFETLPFATAGDQAFRTTRLRSAGNYVTQPGNAFKFPSDNTPIKQDAGRFIPEMSYSITLFQCTNVNDDLIASLINKVNAGVFMGRPEGTVRFDGADSEVTQTVSGIITNNITLNLVFRPIPHNYLLRPDGGFEEAVDTSSGNPMYDLADLSPLLNLV
ncbi:hypothetical protein ACYOEI_01585 [Singulisphaera rosea]